jgi:protein phosphatase
LRPRLRIEAGGQSHPGLVRENNEDSFLVLEPLGLFAVADGMGGRASGEVASKLAIDALQSFFTNPDVLLPRDTSMRTAFLDAAVRYAHLSIRRAARDAPERRGMGTTLTVALAVETQVHLAHVGDSRAYLLRGHRLERLTEDHTLVNEAVRRGMLTPGQAGILPIRHVLTRALGTKENVHVDVRHMKAMPKDVILLCSDGLTERLPESAIAHILQTYEELDKAAEALIASANERGGVDNVTCVLVRWAI